MCLKMRCTFVKFSTPTLPHTTIHYYIFTLVRLKACRRDMGLVQKCDRNEAYNQRHNAYSIRFINGLLLKLGRTKWNPYYWQWWFCFYLPTLRINTFLTRTLTISMAHSLSHTLQKHTIASGLVEQRIHFTPHNWHTYNWDKQHHAKFRDCDKYFPR